MKKIRLTSARLLPDSTPIAVGAPDEGPDPVKPRYLRQIPEAEAIWDRVIASIIAAKKCDSADGPFVARYCILFGWMERERSRGRPVTAQHWRELRTTERKLGIAPTLRA